MDPVGNSSPTKEELRVTGPIENGSLWELMERTGLFESLNSGTARRKFLSDVSADQFISTVYFVGALTTGSVFELNFKGSRPPSMFGTPREEDKEKILRESLECAQRILNDESLSDEVALRRAGIVIGQSITLIHPLENGNGRTSRLMHYLTEFGTEKGQDIFEEELQALITKETLDRDRVAVRDINNLPRQPLVSDAPNRLDTMLERYQDKILGPGHSRYRENPDADAIARIHFMHELMEGNIDLPMDRVTNAASWDDNNKISKGRYPADTVPYIEAVEREYLEFSSIPHAHGRNPTLPGPLDIPKIDRDLTKAERLGLG